VNQFLDFARTDGGEAVQHADLRPSRRKSPGISAAMEVRRDRSFERARASMQHVDASRVLNLIDNALRYGAGEVRVTVRAENGAAVLEVPIAARHSGFRSGAAETAFTRLEVARSDKGGAAWARHRRARRARAPRQLRAAGARRRWLLARIRLPIESTAGA